MSTARVAEQLAVTGTVQGVGFRPFVYRLAAELGLAGHVGNSSAGVFVTVEGSQADIDAFAERLVADAPPLASVDRVSRRPEHAEARVGFSIVESSPSPGDHTLVPADTAVCDDCIGELFDPTDRRHRHPFITCTNCGPRFTIMRSLPYDRANTTMASFEMCEACLVEYTDPGNRRYHAQPISCHDCGPQLSFGLGEDREVHGHDAIRHTVSALAGGLIVAIKGIGGYHLTCDATNNTAIAAVRSRKHRPEKPLAIMVSDLAHAAAFAAVDDLEAEQLESVARPIVLLRARPDTALSGLVAPRTPMVGIMLPYTPVHHLLFESCSTPLVLTSANMGGEPISYRDDEETTPQLADAKLTHDRPIQIPCDDSVVRVADGRLLPLRRARGYAPMPIRFIGARRDVFAVGGDLKNTFCVTSKECAWVGQHIGDMENLETIEVFEAVSTHFHDLFAAQPEETVVDAHPDYRSAKWARARYPGGVSEVQHHHAHIAAVMAEHQLDPTRPVVGFAFDGTGYGDDGSIWGGEVLIADASGYERIAHLAAVPLPGGDAAVRNPYRVALAHLFAAGIEWSKDLAPVARLDSNERELLRRQLETRFACVQTTSMGRLFDAVASLVGLRHEISFEAQAAIELEIAAESGTRRGGYRFAIDRSVIDPAPVLRRIIADLRNQVQVADVAMSFHHAVADAVVRIANRTRNTRGFDRIVLSGGVFQNALLVTLCVRMLEVEGFETLTHSFVPPNDGGLSLGQAFIAAHRRDAAAPEPPNAEEL